MKKHTYCLMFFMLMLCCTACITNTLEPTVASVPTVMSVPTVTPIPTVSLAVTLREEQPVVYIPLEGPIAKSKAEVSGMTWYGDHLILLPQYPSRLKDALFALPKADILAYLDGSDAPSLEPQVVPFDDGNIGKDIKQFQGYEAIAFVGEQVFLTIESGHNDDMVGYLIAGDIAPDLSKITLDADHITPIAPQSTLDNATDESLLVVDETLVTLYELNGTTLNDQPVAHRFDFDLNPLDTLSFPHIPYRVTDVTALQNGQFWGINYFYPGDKKHAASDPLAEQYGKGLTHSQYDHVERLVLFDYSEQGITRVEQSPIQLELSDEARNWEGIVRLDERGFLLVTDTHPETLLAFVALP